jgi:hypothetical protein
MGMGEIKINDTVGISGALQRALNRGTVSTIVGLAAFNSTSACSGFFAYGGLVTSTGTYSHVVGGYSSTQNQLGYSKGVLTTSTGANQVLQLRVGSLTQGAGLSCGNTKFSGGGGRGTITFCLPTYATGQNLFIGYSGVAAPVTGDPITWIESASPKLPCLGIVKQDVDSTLFFVYRVNGGLGSVTKVNIGIKPNINAVYRLQIYISPDSKYYMELEVLSKTGTSVYTISPTTNVPSVGTRMIPFIYANNVSTTTAIQLGIINVTEEIY